MYGGIGQLRLGQLVASSLCPSFPFQQRIAAQVAQRLPEVLIYDGALKHGKVVTQDRVALPPPCAPFPTIHV